MRERLFRVIGKLADANWKPHAELMIILRRIAENEDPEVIEELLEAFRNV